MNIHKIREFCKLDKKSIKPESGVMYHVYSLPAFDNDKTTEYLDGEDIKSTKFVVHPNTILFNKLNIKFKRVWNIGDDVEENGICSTEFLPLKIFKDGLDKDFLYYVLISDNFTKVLNATRQGTSNSHQRIDIDNVLDYEIDLPSIERQKEIAKILRNIDSKIGIDAQIKQNLYKQMETIFMQMYYFSDKSSAWRKVKLGEVTEQYKERVREKELPVYSVLHTGEMVLSEEHFTKQVYSADTSNYFVVPHGFFAYNPARVNIGAIAYNDKDEGCVSTLYIILKTDKAYENFFRFYFRTYEFNMETQNRASGSVRQYFYYPNFSTVEINYPPESELSSFNHICDRYFSDIKIVENEMDTLLKTRELLMPQLLFGKE